MAEISDAALAELQQAHALLKSLYSDSGVGMDFRKIVKKAFPKASIPELEAVEHTEALGTKLSEKFAEAEKTLTGKIDAFLDARKKEREDADVETFSTRIHAIAKDRGYTEDGTKKLLELMKERGIQDPEDAAIIFESRQPKAPAKPRSFSSRMAFVTPDDKDDEAYKRLMADPEQYMVDELLTAINTDNDAK